MITDSADLRFSTRQKRPIRQSPDLDWSAMDLNSEKVAMWWVMAVTTFMTVFAVVNWLS